MFVLVRKTHGEMTNVYGPFETAEDAYSHADKIKQWIISDGLGVSRWVLDCTEFHLWTLEGRV